MRLIATNQAGHTIECHDFPCGWASILNVPFGTREMAEMYLDGMPREAGKEYRVYPALAKAVRVAGEPVELRHEVHLSSWVVS